MFVSLLVCDCGFVHYHCCSFDCNRSNRSNPTYGHTMMTAGEQIRKTCKFCFVLVHSLLTNLNPITSALNSWLLKFLFFSLCAVSEPPNYKMKPLRRQVQSTHHVSPYSQQNEGAAASATKAQQYQPTSTTESEHIVMLW